MQGILPIIRHIALAALILRAMLPSGWMPDAHAGLIICSASFGLVQQDPASGHHDEKTLQEHCVFAAAAHGALAPVGPQLELPGLHSSIARTDRIYAASLATRFTPQSPRAPPIVA